MFNIQYQEKIERFLEDFNKFKNSCNEKRIEQGYLSNGIDKYYLAVILIDGKPSVKIEQVNILVNEFVLLGYFLDLGDIQKARSRYERSIIKLYKSLN